MKQQFYLTLTNRWKAIGVMGGCIALLGIMAAAVMNTMGRYSPVAAAAIDVVLLFGWVLWVMPQAAQRFCAESAVAILNEKGLKVQYMATGTVRRVDFVDMASYSLGFSNFTIRTQAGPTLNMHLNSRLHPEGLSPMMEFEQCFHRAVASYQRRNPQQPPIQELGFFSRPMSTVILTLLAALAGWEGWRTFRASNSEGAWGKFLFIGLLFAIYALVWHHHRKQLE
jgi:hypothetical protein